MSLDHDIWFNLTEKAMYMPDDGVKFCGIICNAEVWLVKDKAVEEYLRRPSVKPVQVNPASDASAKARAELRDRFAMAALTGLLANAADDGSMGAEEWCRDAYLFADAMMKARGNE